MFNEFLWLPSLPSPLEAGLELVLDSGSEIQSCDTKLTILDFPRRMTSWWHRRDVCNGHYFQQWEAAPGVLLLGVGVGAHICRYTLDIENFNIEQLFPTKPQKWGKQPQQHERLVFYRFEKTENSCFGWWNGRYLINWIDLHQFLENKASSVVYLTFRQIFHGYWHPRKTIVADIYPSVGGPCAVCPVQWNAPA